MMQYKQKKDNENNEEFFVYDPKYNKNKEKKINKKQVKNNPFGKLSELRFR